MVKIYYDLIKMGYRKIDDVPLRWQADVQKMLDSDG
ncbi:CD1375 family protein [Caldifermentibacillus hisashii]